jgi:hypothetical protein
MHNQMVSTTGPLNLQARAIVEAVLEAIDIPHAATVEGAETRQAILTERLRHLRISLKSLAVHGDTAWALADLEKQLAEHPATGYLTTGDVLQRTEDGATWDEAVGS